MNFNNISQNIFYLNRTIQLFIGKINLIYALWWKISIGKDLRFIGKCHFYRYPYSKITIGNNCTFLSKSFSNQIGINRKCMISTQSEKAHIFIGDNCGFSGTVIGCFVSIKIGNNVRVGANTLITDADWHTDDYRSGEPKPIIIEDNVWIGEGVKVLKGVTIGENSLIGAGSIVTRDIPANVIAAGNPCVIIKNI